MEKEEKALIAEALEVYKIPEKYVFASRAYMDTGEAVIVTCGGKKIRHRKGEPAKLELTEVQITGELPKEEMVWHEKLNQRIGLKGIYQKHKDRFKKMEVAK